ncbi:MAG: DUF1652 domain-containing protein [Pseudomonas sp.]|uniref:DUF1652 domain-containing protein n=1 Tax=Pseudomonas sp. TaxID=306 RepID=UPI003395F484
MIKLLAFEESRGIVEASFSPLSCECQKNDKGDISIRLFDQAGTTYLQLDAISAARFTTKRALAQLVLEVRQRYATLARKNQGRPLDRASQGRISRVPLTPVTA